MQISIKDGKETFEAAAEREKDLKHGARFRKGQLKRRSARRSFGCIERNSDCMGFLRFGCGYSTTNPCMNCIPTM